MGFYDIARLVMTFIVACFVIYAGYRISKMGEQPESNGKNY